MPGLLPSSEPKRPALPAWVFVALGLLALGYVGRVYIHQQEFLDHAARAQGTVVDHWQAQRRGTTYYAAIFTFTDADGKTWRAFEQDHRKTQVPAPIGQARRVVYNPDNPAQAEIEADSLLADVFARTQSVCLIGGLLLLRGLLYYGYAWFKRPRRPPNDNGGVPRDPAILAGP